MNITLKRISSLEKVRSVSEMNEISEITSAKVLAGEQYSFQVCCTTQSMLDTYVFVESALADYIDVYSVKNAVADRIKPYDDDMFMTEPGLVPDILVPLSFQKDLIKVFDDVTALWLNVKIPRQFAAGVYPIKLRLENYIDRTDVSEISFELEVLPAEIPSQSTIYTQWFYPDCIADVHGVEIYSEMHWELVEKYMKLARDIGINMILTPIITPPLDTEIGVKRPCTQLVKIEKCGEKYLFDFTLLDRWIDMSIRCGIEYFEMAHLFSQWGLKFTPNIKVWENGAEYYKFDTSVASTDPSYKDFLYQFLPELIKYLKNKGIYDKCYFHISDEPNETHLEAYEYARDVLVPVLGEEKIMDAMSHVEYYKNGLTKLPVVGIDFMEDFLPENIENRWGYYCSSQWKKVSNRFLAMPSYRNRIIGLQIYKFNLVGFLHWGYNYYNSQNSRYNVNPYMTSSCDKTFESGDAFTVYPMVDGPVPSLRGLIFNEALQDVEVCKKLEEYIGRDAVVKMIDDVAGMDVTFKEYPRNSTYIPNLMQKMKSIIAEYSVK